MNAVKRLEDFDDANFDPFVADEAMFGACLDPYPKLAALRDKGPVHALDYRVYMGEHPDLTSSDVEHFTVVGYDEVAAGAANRDPARFDEPDRFNIFRKSQHRHFAFAFGPHICIGQHLARIEMTRALNSILDRLPNLRLDPDRPKPEIRGIMMRVPKHIYVRFDAKGIKAS
jgi:cytochrome P450